MNVGNQQAYGNANEPAPSMPIPGALGRLSTAIHELEDLAETLGIRLCGVMVATPPAAESKGGGNTLSVAEPMTSPMVGEIDSYRRRVARIAAQLQDALKRLEV